MRTIDILLPLLALAAWTGIVMMTSMVLRRADLVVGRGWLAYRQCRLISRQSGWGK